MTSENTAPPAFGTPHRGITLGTYTRTNPSRQANYDLCHDVDDATYSVVGRGVPGYPGEFVFNFQDVVPPIFGQFKYTINDEIELLGGYQYTQVRSKDNPQGAVRGQLSFVDPIPTLAVTGRMDGNQAGEDSFARGCVLVSFDCDTRKMEYLVFHSVSQPSRLEAHAAPPGFTGPLLFALDSISQSLESPIYGSRVLGPEEEYVLYAQQMYFLLTSENFPTGEIRGQLTAQFDYFAHMTGIQMVPPITTANLGCATFDLTDINYGLDFEIMHSIEDVISVDMFHGSIGSPGDPLSIRRFAAASFRDSPESPVIGSMVMDDDDQVALITDQTFVQVSSENYPFGEIRGQMMRIRPCDPNPRPYSATSETLSFDGSFASLIELPLDRDGGSIMACSLLVVCFCAFVALLF
eukprot:CAMPEP_0117012846 /NCGR_PEP_ID=MMETSP0472-20121206/10716_1 /TAXON_ID=693140 ORGANISM="Tiarina fusus, Strain LIS" /NCGR_SAMPLE_ID=MMETSP0472 /ASSEMBLY_ACC=CAM_ASM_000603 /LENGTH=407 /DNA_ID=CAMNT_0004716003 /DNA_START=494 /DNA_END=1717 /DNA_ORIENTATION=+